MNQIDKSINKMLGKSRKKSINSMNSFGLMTGIKPINSFKMMNNFKSMKGFDSMINTKPMNSFKMINNFKPMNNFKLKSFGGKNDLDGDGVPNRFDCQPRNVMRQDATNQKWFSIVGIDLGSSDEYSGEKNYGSITEEKIIAASSAEDAWYKFTEGTSNEILSYNKKHKYWYPMWDDVTGFIITEGRIPDYAAAEIEFKRQGGTINNNNY